MSNNAVAMPKRALISVSDKQGISAFASRLQALGWEILSTGGTAETLRKEGVDVVDVSDVTQFPECFSGRVKTMHPLIMGGVLMRRGEDDADAKKLGIEPIDLVVVNLYPFEETLRELGNLGNRELGEEDYSKLIEKIDIGGPTLLRSAAKNHKHVTVICETEDYDRVIEQIEKDGDTSLELRAELAVKVFERTMAYDAAITKALSREEKGGILLRSKTELRYGENPHQQGHYSDLYGNERAWNVIQEEKQMSYLNILDADGAWNLVCEYTDPTAACIKHANPSGVASHEDISKAFQRCYDADRLSAFGVIVALNRPCPAEVIQKIIDQKIFAEVIIAPGYEDDALKLLKKRPKLRAIEMQCSAEQRRLTARSMLGGMLVQDMDTKVVTKDDLTVVTDSKPSEQQIADLLFAWGVVKHAKSNAIVFAKDLVTTGIGCGQTSRVDSTIIAARRAGGRAKGSVMASDAFFPFPDSVEEAAKNGITAIIQPGGSIRDDEVIAKANELGIAMVTTGIRAFRH